MRTGKDIALSAACLLIAGVMLWQAFAASGNPDPLSARVGSPAGILDIGVLVFREGLECILVLAAITAGMSHSERGHGASVGPGVGLGFIATLISWVFAVTVVDDLSRHISALQLQAATYRLQPACLPYLFCSS